jgi:hypothetical protein
MDGSITIASCLVGGDTMTKFVSSLRDASVDIDIPAHFSDMFSGPSSMPGEVFARFMLVG